MKNIYEFDIEDIMVASVKSLQSDEYTTKFVRDMSDDQNRFIESYEAKDEVLDDRITAVCPRCGHWQKFDINDEIRECEKCDEEYRNMVDESYVIDQIKSWFSSDIFFDHYIEINGQEIK